MTVTRRIGLAFVAGLVCVVAVFGTALWHGGYRIYVIHTGSMEPTLPLGTAVITKPARVIKPGDIITFRHSDVTTDLVTHRIAGFTADGLISTKGDANKTADPWEIRPDQVQGVEAYTVPKLGYLLIFLQQPSGLGSLITSMFAIFLLWGLFFPTVVQEVRVARHRHRAPSRRSPAAARRSSAPIRSAPAPGVLSVPVLVDAERTAVMSRSDVAQLHALLDGSGDWYEWPDWADSDRHVGRSAAPVLDYV